MESLSLAAALLAWTVGSFIVAGWAASAMPARWGFLAAPLAVMLLVALPLMDEARAKVRFRALCQDRAQLRLAPGFAPGQAVSEGRREVVVHDVGSLIAVETVSTFHDQHSSGAPAFDYSRLAVQPGWFVSTLVEAVGLHPLLFERTCEPSQLKEFISRQEVEPAAH